MTVLHLSRRQLLLGGGGFALAMPLLRSLQPRSVRAQAAAPERRFVAFATDHGGLLEDAMFPSEALLTEQQELYTGHAVRRGPLQAVAAGGRLSLSAVLTGPADRLSPGLLTRMNVVRGLDIPFYIAHHTGGHLGNYARNDGNGSDGEAIQNELMPTIDQIMAWSDSFYEDTAGIVERAMVLGNDSRLAWAWSSPASRAGGIQEVATERDPLAMFRKIFVPGEAPSETPARAPIVDRVLESYRSLRESDRRLSAADRQRLDDHMERLSELERRLNATPVTRASCGELPPPAAASASDPKAYYAAVNDVIVAAFLCGTSRIAVLRVGEASFVDYEGDWHQEVAHQYLTAEPQRLLQEANQQAFEHAVLDLAHKLDIEEFPGQSLLDSTLVQWTQESGDKTHNARSLPLVTFGGAGGALSTGHYCDYRKRTPDGQVDNGYGGYSGLLYAQWLATALQAVGVPRGEFQEILHNGATGYGHPFMSPDYESTYADGVVARASDPLPFLGV